MSKLVPILLGLLILSPACRAEDKKAAKEEVVRKFATAFFSENKKDLLELSSDQLQMDFQKYFWIKEHMTGAKSEAREWKGKIEIVGSRREKIIATYVNLTESDEDVYEIAVDGKHYKVGVDDKLKVILFNDAEKKAAIAP